MTADAPPASISKLTVVGIASAAALVPLNSTMIAVALPSIADDFDISTAEVSVLITLYLVCMLVGQPVAGRVADKFGSRRTVLVALIGLALFSGLAAFTTTFSLLVLARVLQAICAAALSPSAQALLRALAPAGQQGRVFGIFGSVLAVGASAGPVVGGVLVALFDWRAIFVFNVPIALIATMATRAVPSSVRASPPKLRERADEPTRRLVNPVFIAGYSGQALSTQAQYTLLLLIPLVLNARGWNPASIGLVLASLTFGMAFIGPRGGRLGDSYGYRLPASVGLGVGAIAIGGLLMFGGDIPVGFLIVVLLLFGLGTGAAVPNLLSAALTSVPDNRTGVAAGILSTSRYAGSVTTGLLIALLVTEDGSGARSVLTISIVSMVAAMVSTRWLPGRPLRSRSQLISLFASWPGVSGK